MTEQQVGGLQVTMENPVVMEMVDGPKQLDHKSLDLTCNVQNHQE